MGLLQDGLWVDQWYDTKETGGHFKCNIRRISDYANLSGYVRYLYQQPGVVKTVNMEHIENHYYASHETINPSRVIPTGPVIDFALPHDRTKLG